MTSGAALVTTAFMSLRTACLAVLLATSACSSLPYDLSNVPFPVSASPGDGEPFRIEAKQVLWVHGLLGEKRPDVGARLQAEIGDGTTSVSDFRVSTGANFWDWLGTHLSLGFVRLKTVVIEGRARH